ncbi:hypothetical protein EV363DRAFT_1155114 [Boletus edulis]|nr:hypothetical protein EV363DRAFT_1155114 [Boletus edulis]
MHLFLENIVPTLVKLWTGQFKGIDEGKEQYEIAPHIWEEIVSNMTAEAWGFWFMFIAPAVLQGRFKHPKYYRHACDLASLMRLSIKLEITQTEVDQLRDGFIKWVKMYEKFYYQYSTKRLPTCTLPIHGALHVAADIENCGPVWVHWTFFLERYCCFLKSSLQSRRHPWSNLANRVLHCVYLTQVDLKFDLKDELKDFRTRRGDELLQHEQTHETYTEQVLRPPCQLNYEPDQDLRRRIALYFVDVLGGRRIDYMANLPVRMKVWGKLRIRGGDLLRTSWALKRMKLSLSTEYRNNCYVRFEVTFDQDSNNAVTVIQYGRLEKILEFETGSQNTWRGLKNTYQLLALISPCKTSGKDALHQVVEYKDMKESIITDIRNIKAVVGRVKSRGRWIIVDRSMETVLQAWGVSNHEGSNEGSHPDEDSDNE